MFSTNRTNKRKFTAGGSDLCHAEVTRQSLAVTNGIVYDPFANALDQCLHVNHGLNEPLKYAHNPGCM